MITEETLGDFVRPDLRPRSEAPGQDGAVVKWRKKMEKGKKGEICFIKSSQNKKGCLIR